MTPRLETRSSFLWIDDDGILHVQTKPVHEKIQDAIDTVNAALKLIGSKKRAAMVDLRLLSGQDKDANAYYRGAMNSTILLAAAYVVPSRLGVVIGNIFIPKKGEVPIRLFHDTTAGTAWLKAQLEARDRTK